MKRDVGVLQGSWRYVFDRGGAYFDKLLFGKPHHCYISMLYIFIIPHLIFYRTPIILIAFFTSNQGIAEVESASITLYPNPASEKVTLEGIGNETNVFVINTMGKIVKRLENTSGSVIFSVADLPEGIYFVRVGSAVRKLVVE